MKLFCFVVEVLNIDVESSRADNGTEPDVSKFAQLSAEDVSVLTFVQFFNEVNVQKPVKLRSWIAAKKISN